MTPNEPRYTAQEMMDAVERLETRADELSQTVGRLLSRLEGYDELDARVTEFALRGHQATQAVAQIRQRVEQLGEYITPEQIAAFQADLQRIEEGARRAWTDLNTRIDAHDEQLNDHDLQLRAAASGLNTQAQVTQAHARAIARINAVLGIGNDSVVVPAFLAAVFGVAVGLWVNYYDWNETSALKNKAGKVIGTTVVENAKMSSIWAAIAAGVFTFLTVLGILMLILSRTRRDVTMDVDARADAAAQTGPNVPPPAAAPVTPTPAPTSRRRWRRRRSAPTTPQPAPAPQGPTDPTAVQPVVAGNDSTPSNATAAAAATASATT